MYKVLVCGTPGPSKHFFLADRIREHLPFTAGPEGGKMVKAWRQSLKLDFKAGPHCDSTSCTEHHTKTHPLLSSVVTGKEQPQPTRRETEAHCQSWLCFQLKSQIPLFYQLDLYVHDTGDCSLPVDVPVGSTKYPRPSLLPEPQGGSGDVCQVPQGQGLALVLSLLAVPCWTGAQSSPKGAGRMAAG